MKNVKGKYIRLTNDDLNRIVKEVVDKQLKLIMEFNIPRSKFIDNADGHIGVMFEHIFLVKYSTLIGNNTYVDHWRKEIFKFMTNISKKGIKGANTYDIRKKAIETAFDYNSLFNGEGAMLHLIEAKLIEERVDLEREEVKTALQYCVSQIGIIIDLLARGNAREIYDYIQVI